MSAVQLSGRELLQPPFVKSFAGHQTFAFRHSWLKKGIDQLITDPQVFQREDAIVRLGVGKNMVRSIRQWCLATRVAEEEPGTRGRCLRPTNLGSRLLSDDGWDPFLEDDATLWLIHWNLASTGTRAATWYWAFNRFHEYAFTRAAMVEALTRALQILGWYDISDSTLKRDVDCFAHTYLSRREDKSSGNDSIECPLTSLGILFEEPDSERLWFRVGPKTSLPAEVFAYAIAEFWNQRSRKSKTLELREIMRAEGSPALVFRLDGESVLCYLDNLGYVSTGGMIFEDTALVRRLIKLNESPMDPMSFLEAYYGSR